MWVLYFIESNLVMGIFLDDNCWLLCRNHFRKQNIVSVRHDWKSVLLSKLVSAQQSTIIIWKRPIFIFTNLISHRRSLRFHDGSVDALVFKPREKLLVTGRHWHGLIFSQWEQRIVSLQPITGRENGSWFIFLWWREWW